MHQIDNGIKENFFRWDGRLNRLRFLKRLLALFGISIVLYILMGILVLLSGGAAMQPNENTFTGLWVLHPALHPHHRLKLYADDPPPA